MLNRKSLKDIISKIIFNEFFVLSLFVFFIVFPIFFSNGSIFLIDYIYGYCANNSLLVNIFSYNFSIIDFVNQAISFLFGCYFFSRIYLFFALFVFVYSFFKLSLLFTKNKRASFVVAFFSLVNPFIYDRLGNGQIDFIFGCGLFVFLFYIVFDLILNKEILDKKFNYKIILFIVLYSLSILFSPHFIFISLFLFPLLFYVFYLKKPKIRILILFIVLFLGVFSIINVKFLLGNFSYYFGSYVKNIDLYSTNTYIVPVGKSFSEVLFNSLNLSNQFTENVGYNYKSLVYEYQGFLFYISSIILFCFFVFGVFITISNKKNRFFWVYVYLIFLFLASLILAFGISPHTIFYNINKTLFDVVPVYKSMRDTAKWDIVLLIVYSVFISICFNYIAFSVKNNNKTKYLFIIFIVAIVLRTPYLFFGMNGYIVSVTKPIPRDFYFVRSYLLNNTNKNDSIIVLPWTEYCYPRFLYNDKVHAVANYFSKFFPGNVYDFTNTNKIGDYYLKHKDVSVDKLKQNSFSTEYLKSLDLNYIIYIKPIDEYDGYFDVLSKSKDMDILINLTNISLFKIK